MVAGKNRIGYIDELKGFAILLVIAGHVLQYILYKETFFDNKTFQIIYMFHMSLFFILSGMFAKDNVGSVQALATVIKRRTLQLFVPYVIWTLFVWLWHYPQFSAMDMITNPGISYWFLWVLYVICIMFECISYIHSRYDVNRWLLCFIAYVVCHVFAIATDNLFVSTFIWMYFLVYLCGYFLQKNNVIEYVDKRHCIPVAFFILVCMFYCGTRCFGLMDQHPFNDYYILLRSIIGSKALVMLFYMCRGITTPLRSLGTETLAIYIVHFSYVHLIAGYWNCEAHKTIVFFICLLVVLLLSLYTVKLINRVKPLRFLIGK